MTDIVHATQTAAEGVIQDNTDRVTFMGADFRMANRIGLMPLMRFAQAAKAGLDSDDMEGLAALYTLIRDCIDTTRPDTGAPSEWDRFEQHAIDTKAEADDLLKVVQDVIEKLAARPTQRPAASSAGPLTTSEPSKVTSSTRAPEQAAELVDIKDLLARSVA